jgi:hypothetical protein
MMRSLKNLERYRTSTTDGELGIVANFLLDDDQWTIRYLVVDTGGLLGGRHVLVSPISFGLIDWSNRRFHLTLSTDKLKNGPSVDLEKPVSRQHEAELQSYYGYPPYWGSPGLWGPGTMPGPLAALPTPTAARLETADTSVDDVHLRSANELRTYDIQGTDGAVGHVADFIIEDETWRLPYLVVDTSKWWMGEKVLIAPQWASRVSWEEGKVHLDLSRDQIKHSPTWNPDAPVNHAYEERHYDFYGRPAYRSPRT